MDFREFCRDFISGFLGRVPQALGGRTRRTDSIPSSSDSCVMQTQRDSVGQRGGGGSKPGARTTLGARSTCLPCVRTPATDFRSCTGGGEEDLRASGKEGEKNTWHGHLAAVSQARLLFLLCLNRIANITLPKTEPQ